MCSTVRVKMNASETYDITASATSGKGGMKAQRNLATGGPDSIALTQTCCHDVCG